MIFIEITNIKEIVREERGWISANVGPYFTDLEARVEQEVIAEILANFEARGVKTNISSASGIHMRSIDFAVKGLVQHRVGEQQDADFDEMADGIE